MANQTVIELDFNCSKCKKIALHSVTKIEGIDSLTINIKESTLTVIGDADPTCMTNLLRKKFRCARLISFGAVPKPKPKPDPPKPADPPKPKCVKCGKEFEAPKCCPECERKCNPPCWAGLCIQVKWCPPCWDCSPYYEPPACTAPNLIYPRQPRAPCWARSEIPYPPYCRPYAPGDVWYVCAEDDQKSCPIMWYSICTVAGARKWYRNGDTYGRNMLSSFSCVLYVRDMETTLSTLLLLWLIVYWSFVFVQSLVPGNGTGMVMHMVVISFVCTLLLLSLLLVTDSRDLNKLRFYFSFI